LSAVLRGVINDIDMSLRVSCTDCGEEIENCRECKLKDGAVKCSECDEDYTLSKDKTECEG